MYNDKDDVSDDDDDDDVDVDDDGEQQWLKYYNIDYNN